MKRIFWILATPALILLVLGIIVNFLIFPKISDLAMAYAQENLRTLGLELSVGRTRLKLQRLSVYISDIVIQGSMPGLQKEITVEQIQVRVDPLGLLLGQLRLSAILLDGLQVHLDMDELTKNPSPPQKLPLEEIFQWKDRLPIELVALRRAQIFLTSKKSDIDAQLKPVDALLTNLPQRLMLRVYAPGISLFSSKFKEPAGLSLEALASLEKDKLVVQSAQVMTLGQTINLKGTITNPENLLLKPKGQAEIKISSDLIPLSEKLRGFQKNLPPMKGQISLESNLEFHGKDDFSGEARLKTRDIEIDKFQVGDLETVAKLAGQQLRLDEIVVFHPSGRALLSKNILNLNAPYGFSSQLSVKEMDLQKLFVGLNLPGIPVWLNLAGELLCEGQINDFDLACQGEVDGKNLLVRSGVKSSDTTIVELEKGRVTGTLKMDLEKVQLKTVLQVGNTQGIVDGEVFFKSGFDFRFKTDSFDFKNIKNLAQLRFEGQGKLEGFTRGDSNAAVLHIDNKVQGFVFEDFFLGNLDSQLRYEKGHLLLEKINGTLPHTLYSGNVDVDLNHSRLSGDFHFPKTDLMDIVKIFERIYHFPIDLRAEGGGEVKFSGPFDFWKMSYTIDSRFKNGQLHTESFSALDFKVKSEEGLVQTQQVELRKNNSLVKVTGDIQPTKQSRLSIDGSNWRLEESELVNKIKNNLLGALNFNAQLTGPITSPELHAKGHLAELIVDEQEIPSSYFQFRLNNQVLEGESNLFGNKIQSDIRLPLGDAKGALKIRAKTVDWNFAAVLGLLGAPQLQEEYEAQMTAEVDLQSETGDWTAMSGSVLIKTFFLKRGILSVKNEETVEVRMNKGLTSIKKFSLVGPGTSVQIRGDGFSATDLNLSVKAQSDLRLGHIFLPFLEDIGGPFSLQATLSGSYKRPEVLGNAKLENIFIKFKGFPHPVEKLQADVIFSHSKVIIQDIKGLIGGGNVTGEGNILISGIKSLPTQVRLKAESLNLSFPEKVRSQGYATLMFSGEWFPFILSGDYHVTNALIEKNFDDGGIASSQVRESIYLPKTLKESTFDPVVLDLQVHLDRNVLIKNNQMDGMITGQLQIKGPPHNPGILGKINVEKNAKLIFKDKVFEIQTGTATFNHLEDINPDVFLSAQSRVNDYDINLLVQGPSKNANIRLTSVPPLAHQEIISLLALGVTSEKLDQTVQSKDQATKVGYEAGAVLLSQTGTDKYLQSKLGVNVQIISSFDNSKNINVPKLTFSKKVSRRWSTAYSQGMGTEQTSREVKIQYQINNNLSAVGSWEGREVQEGTTVRSVTQESQSVFGLDLEFKREFK